jgi:acyl carrier protein
VTLEQAHLSERKRALLERYLARAAEQTAAPARAIPRRDSGDRVPLSFEQLQRWHLQAQTPAVPLYHQCVSLSLPGPLDGAALARALNALIARHEMWRTRMAVRDGEPEQVVLPSAPVNLRVVDLSSRPEETREDEAAALATAEARQPFDLLAAPPLRSLLVHFDHDRHRLSLTLHDVIADCVSLYNVFLPELRVLYESELAGRPASLPPLPIQYADYACWQRARRTEEALAGELAAWRERLAGAPTSLPLPPDYACPLAPRHAGAVRPFALPAGLSQAIRTLARQEGATLFMTLLTAYAALVYGASGQEDLVIGTVSSAGRLRPEVQMLLGWFVNTVALRVSLAGDPSFRELLTRVREVALGAFAQQDTPYELVARAARDGALTDVPLFQTMLVLEPAPPVLDCGWTLTLMEDRTGTAKFDLSLILNDGPEGLVGRCEYATERFEPSTIERLLTDWEALLARAVADPALPLSILCRRATLAAASPSAAPPVAPQLDPPPEVASAEPLTALQRQLVPLWEEVLETCPVALHDDFFELGGDSLRAARLVARIEETLGRPVPLEALFTRATVAHLADVLARDTAPGGHTGLLAARAGGSEPPLFFLHGDWSGNGLWCANLARYLPPEQPVYAVEPFRLEGPHAVPRFEEMAAAHLREIRAVQRHGPYRLGGFCNGALVAYEMAQQLLAAGEPVELLLLVDPEPGAPATHRLLRAAVSRVGRCLHQAHEQQIERFLLLHLLYGRLRDESRRRLQGTAAPHPAELPGLASAALGRWARGVVRGVRVGLRGSARQRLRWWRAGLMPDREAVRHDWVGMFDWMAAQYTVRPYPGKAAVFWSSGEPGSRHYPERVRWYRKWQRVVRVAEEETHSIPGTHVTCRTRHIQALAAHLQGCLAAAARAHPHASPANGVPRH